jgi:hypothetical protein
MILRPEGAKKRGRPPGRSPQTIKLIAAMRDIAEVVQPVTGRGVGYKLFVAKLIDAMSKMQKVYRLLKEAREEGIIPWPWIVDETREPELVAAWDDPEQFARDMTLAYRKDFWNTQPIRVEVWSEKGTVRGVIKPVLDHYGITFNPVHGFNSATNVHNACAYNTSKPLIIIYVGDFDPSGLYMSEVDLPKRFANYGGSHITLKRIAVTREQTSGLLSFPATDKVEDPRYDWFVENHGDRCWELDAMDPRDLRALIKTEIEKLIDPEEWARYEAVNKAEQESIRSFVSGFKDIGKPAPRPEWEFNWLREPAPRPE